MRARGFTLVEAIVAIVVLAAASTGVLLVFSRTAASSADPQIRVQARAIAAAYMDEILLKAYREPDPTVAETDDCEAGESRATFDDVFDYDCLTDGDPPRNQLGDPFGGSLPDPLAEYAVDVDVPGSADGSPATITVTVSHSSGVVSYTVTSQRADY